MISALRTSLVFLTLPPAPVPPSSARPPFHTVMCYRPINVQFNVAPQLGCGLILIVYIILIHHLREYLSRGQKQAPFASGLVGGGWRLAGEQGQIPNRL